MSSPGLGAGSSRPDQMPMAVRVRTCGGRARRELVLEEEDPHPPFVAPLGTGPWQTGGMAVIPKPLPPGHKVKVERTESGRRWRMICSCGYGLPRWEGDKPPTRATEAAALGQAIWHLRKMEAERRVDAVDGVGPSTILRHRAG